MGKGLFLHIDWVLLTPVIVLIIFGLATLFSIYPVFFRNQLTYIIISLFVYLFFTNINYKVFQLYSLPIYILTVLILSIVLLIGIESRGATRWIEFFGFQIQFSEIFKPFLILALSSFLTKSNTSFKTLFIGFLLLIPVAFLIYRQPDLGNALIYAIVAILIFLFAGFPLKWFIISFLGTVIVTPFIWPFLHGYQRQRVLTFLNPTIDPLGVSYNSIQSVVAVGSGMIFGKGLGQGTQSALRFLPERHTDFIFATFSEEFGFLGSLLLILTFVFLLYKIFLISMNSNDKFCKVFSAGAFFLIFAQAFVNIGMNINLLPIVGVTLPFVSSGGSSMLSNFILLGFLSSISRDLKGRSILEIK